MKAFTTRLKIALTVATLFLAVGVLSWSFHLMNQPSDLKFYLGLLGVLKMFVVVPAAIWLIWNPSRWMPRLRQAFRHS